MVAGLAIAGRAAHSDLVRAFVSSFFRRLISEVARPIVTTPMEPPRTSACTLYF